MPASLGTQYATIADLAAVAAPTNALFGVTAAQQNTALETASRICDDSLSVVYTLPLLTFGTSLVQHVCNIAVYYLFSGKGAAASANMLMYREKFNDAMRWLKRIEEGLRPVGITDSSPSTIDPGGTFCITSAKRNW